MAARKTNLARDGEPTQRTKTGLEIPIISRGKFFEDLGKVVKKAPTPKREPSESDPRTR